MSKQGTAIFVLAAVLLLGGLDLVLALDDIPGNTYSEAIRNWSYSYRWLPYLLAAAFGALLTHWFVKPYEPDPLIPAAWQSRPLKDRLVLAGCLLVTVAVGMGIGFCW